MRWQAIVFDLDDTLYPERQFVRSGMQAVAAWAEAQWGFPQDMTFGELWGRFEQGVRGRIFDLWLESRGIEPGPWVPEMVRVYREHAPRIEPYAEAPPLLARLHTHARLGLITDGHSDCQQRKLAALDLEHLFHAVIYTDAIPAETGNTPAAEAKEGLDGRRAPHAKPSPVPFELMLRQLGVPPARAVYVADNPNKDFRGARRAGMAGVRVRYAEGLYSRLEPCRPEDMPDDEISSLDELEQSLAHLDLARYAPVRRGSAPQDLRILTKSAADSPSSLATESPACNVCGSYAARRLWTEEYRLGASRAELGIVRCRSCGQIYVSPRLDQPSTRLVYEHDRSATISHHYCWDAADDGRRFRKLLRRLDELQPGGKRLLDVGCGSGDFLRAAARTGRWQVTGVEPFAPMAAEAGRRAACAVHATTLEEAPLEPGSFDCVALLGVLEHLHDPRAVLRRAHDLLRPSGSLAVYVPNFHYLRLVQTGPISYARTGRFSSLHPQEHLFHFTPRTLERLLEATGFRLHDLHVGPPFLQGSRLRRWLKTAAYGAACALAGFTGLHLGGLEAIALRQPNLPIETPELQPPR